MARNEKNKTIEDVTIAFRNFAGKEDTYNREGDRNFAVLLDPDLADQMLSEGWNVKHLKTRDEGEIPQAYIQVAVSYKNRPPKICMVTSRGLSYLTENEVEILDWVDIETADVTLNPYEWVVNGKAGVKAYLQTLFIKIEEDYLQEKWTNWSENQKQIGGSANYIDAEIVDDETLQIGR